MIRGKKGGHECHKVHVRERNSALNSHFQRNELCKIANADFPLKQKPTHRTNIIAYTRNELTKNCCTKTN